MLCTRRGSTDYFLRRSRSFSVFSKMLKNFCRSVPASRPVMTLGSSVYLEAFGSVRDRRSLNIMDNPSHLLLSTLRSSFSLRIIQPCCHKEPFLHYHCRILFYITSVLLCFLFHSYFIFYHSFTCNFSLPHILRP